MKNYILGVLLMFTSLAYSQGTMDGGFLGGETDDYGTIDCQRPTLTESYSIIKKNMLQFENGLDYYGNSRTFGYGTFVRGSVHDRVELRLFTDYTNVNSVGAKFIALEADQSAWGIGASFVYNRMIGTNSNDFRVAMTKDFNKVFVTYNFGYNGAIYNIGLIGAPIGDKVSSFVEYYNDPVMNRIHGGFTYIPQRDIQLDINGGWMDYDEWYVGCGVSFRIR